MIEYENTISEFKNKNYFAQLLSKYNFWKNEIEIKHNVLWFIGITSFLLIFLLFIMASILNNLFYIYLMIPCVVTMVLIMVVAVNNLITRNEDRQLENLNDDFIKELKDNQSILQDLSQLVVDEKSKASFFDLTDMVLGKEKDKETLEKLIIILNHSPDVLDNFSYEEKRNSLLKNLNIELKIKESLTTEVKITGKQQSKQKLLEML